VTPDRLAIAIVQAEDAPALEQRLVADGFLPTMIDTTGGFLRRGNVAGLVDLPAERMPELLEAVRAVCRTRTTFWFSSLPEGMIGQPIEVEVGDAVVFVLPIERTHYLAGDREPGRARAAATIGGAR
jgi:uncharacterized protein YaaQ